MWKKLILGSIAIAATGYGIKKLYEQAYEEGYENGKNSQKTNNEDSNDVECDAENEQESNDIFKFNNDFFANRVNGPCFGRKD